MKYLVIGDEDTVLGFSLVGVSGTVVADTDAARAAFDRAIADAEVGIVIMTERSAQLIRDRVDRYLFTEQFPLIVEIPDRSGRLPERPNLRELVNRAIGINV